MNRLLRRSRSARLKLGALASLVCAIAPATRGQSADPSTAQPNVVVILVDDLGAHDLGCTGSTFYETPNIDALAASGTRFDQAYAACAVCSPTRAAVLTGRSPARLGITDWIRAGFQSNHPDRRKGEYGKPGRRDLVCPLNANFLPPEEITIAEMLKAQGYATAHIGKWHLGGEPHWPQHQGFDQNHGGCDFGQPPSYFDPYSNKKLKGIPNLPPRETGEYLTDREGDEAVRFIEAHRDQRFFLYLAHYAVHTPIQAKAEVELHYRKKAKTTPQRNAKYAAMVHSVDDAVGRVVATLDRLGLRDNTLILFTSDNGGLIGPTNNEPLRSGKGSPYEGGIRVPLIASWPNRVESGTTSTPATSVDLLPTVAQAVGVELPRDRAYDGESLLPALTEAKPAAGERPLFWHFPHYRYNQVGPYSIVRRGRLKLIRFYESRLGGVRHELYDLSTDPSEGSNLAPSQPKRVAELDQLLARHLEEVEALLPRHPLHFANARMLTVEGQAFADTESIYDRLPERVKTVVRKPVYDLGKDSAGIAIRFVTDAKRIDAHWGLRRGRLQMGHMPASGTSGVDLYTRTPDGWRWVANGRPSGAVNRAQLMNFDRGGAEHEYMLYLPLYNGVDYVHIGVSAGASLHAAPDRPGGKQKPIVFYGTSITQGASASRPGMTHSAILGRRFDRPIINLGFSGNGRLEQPFVELLAEIDAAVYVLDCLPNLNPAQVKARLQPFVRALRAKRPDTPIVLVEDRVYQNAAFRPSWRQRNAANHAAHRAGYEALLAEGIGGLHYIRGEDLLAPTDGLTAPGEATVDGSHPTDLGFARQAEAFAKTLAPLLR